MTEHPFGVTGEATHLHGQQYSWLSSIVYIAQLAFQPLSSFALVKFPVKWWVLFNLFGCKSPIVSSGGTAPIDAFLVSR